MALVIKSRSGLAEHKRRFAHDHTPVSDFLTAIRALTPTAVIGVAAVGGMFTKDMAREMTRLNDRHIIFALSNLTSTSRAREVAAGQVGHAL